ncbi:MAG: DUF503 domain-containing protein [Deltaproteobacteria bacterium]|nr:DUF503 domain-containing protein [Deltaproteobacteria bacterium]
METVVVGVARFVVQIPGCRSLKEKRRIVSALKDRIRARHVVSIAEVGDQDVHGRAVLAMATVGSDARVVGTAIRELLKRAEEISQAPVVEEVVRVENWSDALAGREGEFPDRW